MADEILVFNLSNNFTQIIPRVALQEHKKLNWGNNGIGNRWANKKFNYTAIYNNSTKTYSENDDEFLDEEMVKQFQNLNKTKGIIGIFVHSKRLNITKRPIKCEIDKEIKKYPCVSCGSSNDIICDHKNDIYNDDNVLNTLTQHISDFQPLCNHCNLQKRQIFKNETKNNKIYSAKNFEKYKMYSFEFPWEKKAFDTKNISTKKDTYWYDPVEFNRKIYLYMSYTLPIINEIKRKYHPIY
jgi:hypothetical protein